MAIPTTFPPVQNQAIASYSYTDIAEGTGMTNFYLAQTIDSTGTNTILTTQLARSAVNEISTGDAAGREDDFDLTAFNIPKTIEGTALISFHQRDTDSTSNNSVTITIKKWDGTTETELGTNTTETINDESKRVLLEIPLTRTHFRKGDVLRVTMKITRGGTFPGAGEGIYGTSPAAEISDNLAATETKSIITIPFILDV